MGNKKIIGTVAALVIVAAAGSLWVSLVGLPPRVDLRPHEALGEVLAREALKQLGSGGRIILIRRDTAIFKNPAVDAQLASFHGALRKAGTAVTATNVIKVDPLRVVNVPPGDFLQILRKTSEADVVVSFLGPPVLTADQLGKLGGKIPKVLAVCSGAMPMQVDLKHAFESKLLHAAVLSRVDASITGPATSAPQAWFDHYFVLATSASMVASPAAPERK
jgi:hypothetical protein